MNGHAVVVGGGIGGLLAAHALAGRFERVTILERDRYFQDSTTPAPPVRRGAPQSRCLHLLMAAGAAAFDELTPGWRDALVARGAVAFDALADAAMRFPAGWLPRTVSGITMYACSRDLLEGVLRRRLATAPTVQVREGQHVLGLLSDPLGQRVTGVRTAETDGSGRTDVAADLVVEASGRDSQLPRWMACVSHAGPQVVETVVESGRQYVSRWFHLEPRDAPDWQCLSIAPAAGAPPRSAMMLRAEADRWGVVLLSPVGDSLPADDTAFLDFAAGLGDGTLGAALARAVPVSPIHRYGSTSNRMRHYHRLPAWPAGLVALGDSVCALDPYFGLGMTATARGAVLLRTHLDQKTGGRVAGLEFQKQLGLLNAEPWRLATGCDADGQPLGRDGAHLGRLYEMAPTSPEVARALLAVQHLLRPAESLMDLQPI